MKKNIILSLLATLVSVLGISAQENTYSMVIKLNNGTVLTIGPNEVDSISFNDGQMAFSGQNLSQLVARIDSLGKVVDDNLMITKDIFSQSRDETSQVEEKVNTVLTRLISPNLNIQGSYWYINGEKTNLYSSSYSPYVGDNGNWWLGRYSWSGYSNGQDTGIKARSIEEVRDELMEILCQYPTLAHVYSLFYTKEEVTNLVYDLEMRIKTLESQLSDLKQKVQ